MPVYWPTLEENPLLISQLKVETTGSQTIEEGVLQMLAFQVSIKKKVLVSLRWRHNEHDGVSNHQPHGCLLNRLFRPISKKTSKLCVTGLCVGSSPGPVNSPHKGPVTQKMFPFNDVIMYARGCVPCNNMGTVYMSWVTASTSLDSLCCGHNTMKHWN